MLIYELYIDKFAENIKGLISKLSYLKNLGVDAIWILPHYPSPQVDDGYDVSDFTSVRADLGTVTEFKDLTAAAHDLSLKIIIDLPVNHTSTEHAWFKEARASSHNAKRDYYLWSKTGADMLSAVNAFPNAKLTNWVFNPFTKDYYFATFYPLQPDLNWDNPEVLKEFLKIIDFWADLGVDGFRLDAVTHIIKRKHSISLALPETHNIVKEIRNHIDSKYPDIMLIGEADLPTNYASAYFGKEFKECGMLFDFEGSLFLWLYLFEKDNNYLSIIENNAQTKINKEWIYFLGMHDAFPVNVLANELQEKLVKHMDPTNSYQNRHDKRIALRVAELLGGDQAAIVDAYRMLLSLPGNKLVYYGDELGMRNIKADGFLIDNRHEIRGKFDWNEEAKQEQDPTSLLNQLKQLFVA